MCFVTPLQSVAAISCPIGTARFLRQLVLGCDAVYSEDLSAQQDYDGLQVINPFLEEVEVR